MNPAAKKYPPSIVILDKKSDVPLFRQFHEAIRAAILSQQLPPGYRLLSTREAAQEFGVSRTTASAAYEHLIAEGYLETRGGSGTFVSAKIPEDLLHAKLQRGQAPQKKQANRKLSERGKLIAGMPAGCPLAPNGLRPFAPCLPSVEDFPFKLWSKIAGQRLRRPVRNLLGYGETAGFRPLREAIAAYLGTARAVRCTADQIIIVSGAQQAVDLTSRILLDAGDQVWAENPGYLGMLGTLQASQAEIFPVPVDAEGLNVEAGKRIAPDAKLVCVTPSHQFPLGVTMSLARRLALLEWANSAGAWILEDDYDSEFRYESRPLASLQGLDDDESVIYVGTFSKILSPSLRMGYVVAPPSLVDAFQSGKALLDRHSPVLEQIILADFFDKGHFARHVRRMRNLYAERRDIFIEAFEKELKGCLEISPSAAGLHVVGWLKDGSDDREIARRAHEKGVACKSLSALSIGKPERPGLVMGYAAFDEKEIKRGVKKLASVWSGQRKSEF